MAWANSQYGKVLKFNGSSDSAGVRAKISAFNKLSIECLARWDSFANDDDLMFEYTSNANTNPGAFNINPNQSGGAGAGKFQISFHNAALGRGVAPLRLHAGPDARHRALRGRCVDGVAQSMTQSDSTNVNVGFPTNSIHTLNIFSGAGTSLFGAGAVAKLALYEGVLTATEVGELYRRPFASLSYQYDTPLIWSLASPVITAKPWIYGACTNVVLMPGRPGYPRRRARRELGRKG